MTTIRKIIYEVLPPFEEGEEGLSSEGIFEYVQTSSEINPTYDITFYHKDEDVEPLIIRGWSVGHGNVPTPELIMEMAWRDLDEWFRGQDEYEGKAKLSSPGTIDIYDWRGILSHRVTLPENPFSDEDKIAIGQYMAYWIDNTGDHPSNAFSYGVKLRHLVYDLKRFFGDKWYELTAVDWRYKAFDRDYYGKIVIGLWDYRDPDDDHWLRVQATIDYNFAKRHKQTPYVSVTYNESYRHDPDGGGGGAGVDRLHKDMPYLFKPDQWSEIAAIERWHLVDVNGAGTHWLANAKYHLKEGKIDSAKRSFGWGLVDTDIYEDDHAFGLALGSCEIPELKEHRLLLMQEALWNTILSVCQDRYRDRLRAFYSHIKETGSWENFPYDEH